MEVRVLFGASLKALHSQSFRRLGTRVPGGVNCSGNALWQMEARRASIRAPPSRRTSPDEHPLRREPWPVRRAVEAGRPPPDQALRNGGRGDRVRRLTAQVRPPRSDRRVGVVRARGRRGLCVRDPRRDPLLVVFRQSDGRLSSRRGFTSRRAAATARRRLVESIQRGEVKVARETFESFWLRLLEERRRYMTKGSSEDFETRGRKRLLPRRARS